MVALILCFYLVVVNFEGEREQVMSNNFYGEGPDSTRMDSRGSCVIRSNQRLSYLSDFTTTFH